jgi:hypothetical protein
MRRRFASPHPFAFRSMRSCGHVRAQHRCVPCPHDQNPANPQGLSFLSTFNFRLSTFNFRLSTSSSSLRYIFASPVVFRPAPLHPNCPNPAHPSSPLSTFPSPHRPIGLQPPPARSAFKTKHIFRTSPDNLLPPYIPIPTIHYTCNVFMFQSGAAATVAPSLTCLKSVFSRWLGECSLECRPDLRREVRREGKRRSQKRLT